MAASAIMLTLQTLCHGQLHGTGPLWSPPSQLPVVNPARTQRGVLFNNIAANSTGQVFVFTVENLPGNSQLHTFLNRTDDLGATWAAPEPFTPASLAIGASSPKLVIDAYDSLHVLWSAKVPNALFHSLLAPDGAVVIDSSRVASGVLHDEYATHLTRDANGRLHAIWHEGRVNSTETCEVFHARSLDNGRTWSAPQTISAIDGRHSAFPRAQLEAAQHDLLAVAWRDSVGGPQQWDIQLSVSQDGGATWSAPILAVGGIHMDSDPDVVIDDQDRIHLFWHRYPAGNPFDGAHIRYMHSDDAAQSWSTTTGVQLSEPGQRGHLLEGEAYDTPSGRLWALWKDERDFYMGQDRADAICAFSDDRGITWSAPEFATDEDTLSIGFKAACLLPGGELALHYERTEAGSELRRTYFRRRLLVPLQLTEGQAAHGWSAHPNPAGDVVTLVLPSGQPQLLVLRDAAGRSLVRWIAPAGVSTIDIGWLASGIYCVHDEKGSVLRVVKR